MPTLAVTRMKITEQAVKNVHRYIAIAMLCVMLFVAIAFRTVIINQKRIRATQREIIKGVNSWQVEETSRNVQQVERDTKQDQQREP